MENSPRMRLRHRIGMIWSAALVAIMAFNAYPPLQAIDTQALDAQSLGVSAPALKGGEAQSDGTAMGFQPDLAAKAALALAKRTGEARREVVKGLAAPSLALLDATGLKLDGAWALDPTLEMRPAQFKTTVDRLAVAAPDAAPAPQELRAPTLKQPSALKIAAPLRGFEPPKSVAKPATKPAAKPLAGSSAEPAATVYFAFGSTEIPPTIAEALARKIAAKSKGGRVTLEINGHADTVGGETVNLRLSEQRAEAVKRLLEPALRDAAFEILAHGESHLAEKTRDETREVRNRRVEIYLR